MRINLLIRGCETINYYGNMKRLLQANQHFIELTDSQWEIIKHLVDNGRKCKYCLRTIVNAVLKIIRTGTQWRNLVKSNQPQKSVYYYFHMWQNTAIGKLLGLYCYKKRFRQNQIAQASRTVYIVRVPKKLVYLNRYWLRRNQKSVKGCKRHLVVDYLDLSLNLYASAANVCGTLVSIELL